MSPISTKKRCWNCGHLDKLADAEEDDQWVGRCAYYPPVLVVGSASAIGEQPLVEGSTRCSKFSADAQAEREAATQAVVEAARDISAVHMQMLQATRVANTARALVVWLEGEDPSKSTQQRMRDLREVLKEWDEMQEGCE